MSTTIPLDFITDIWNIFLLVLVRVSGMFYLSPIFGRRNIPNYFKAGFCFFFSIIVSYTIPVPDLSAYNTLLSYAVLIAKELIIGLMLGFISYAFFSSIYIAGQLIDMRIGFGMVSVLDPIGSAQIPISADFYVIFATLYMLVTDSHHLLIKALADSYTLIPAGQVFFDGELINQVVDMFGKVFVIGFKIAAPVTATILITDIALGIISKSMPQMNVFMLGLPVKLILGMSIILITIGAFKGIVNNIIMNSIEEIYRFLQESRGAVP